MRSRSAVVFFISLISIAIVLFLSLTGMLRLVITNSMAPTFNAGDLLIINLNPGEIQPGMVISYLQDGKLITHRVVGFDGEELITKGDNSTNSDPWRVSPNSVVGTPFLRIPYLGRVISFVRQPVGWFLLVIFPAMLIVVDEIRKIYRKYHPKENIGMIDKEF